MEKKAFFGVYRRRPERLKQ